jgi:hypothetical protein
VIWVARCEFVTCHRPDIGTAYTAGQHLHQYLTCLETRPIPALTRNLYLPEVSLHLEPLL